MILTPQQIQELLDVIERQHVMFLGTHLGTDVLSKKDIELLTNHGINVKTMPKHGVVDKAFHFGILADALGKKDAKKMNYEEFKKHLSSGKLIPLTRAEQVALDHVKVRLYGDVKGLGNKVSSDFRNIVIESSKKRRKDYEKILQQTTLEAVRQQKTAQELASDLGHKTKDWARDFDRISDYVLHEAYDTGKSVSMAQKSKEENRVVWAYKEVYSGACENCVRLYLTNGVGSKPKIFKITTLMSNGTNIGRKVKDWKPVIGSTHPYSITDARTTILTKKGWKMIKDIQIGDYVLTHKGKFKKVVSKISGVKMPPSHPGEYRYEIKYSLFGNSSEYYKQTLSLTEEHKLLTQRGWVMAKDLKKSDKLIKLMKPCSNEKCDSYLDFFVKNNVNCCSKECEKEVSRKSAESLHVEGEVYDEMKLKISEKVKDNWKKGLHENTKKNLQSDKHRKWARKRLLEGDTALEMLKKSGATLTTKPQIKIFNKVKSLFPDAELEFRIHGKSLDIAIPSLKIDIEYDGAFWHAGREESDKRRDLFLAGKGWSTIRYSEFIPSVSQLNKDISNIANNHRGKYKFEEVSIDSIEKFKLNKGFDGSRLWDIGVEEDESFIARGVVIHNCRCELFELPENHKWDEEKKEFTLKRNTYGVERKSSVKITIE